MNQRMAIGSATLRPGRSTSAEADRQAMVQTTNVIRGSGSIKLDYRINDINGTSLDGKYFVRLAEKQSDGSYKVLEGTEGIGYYNRDNSGSWMNRTYSMGSTYQKVEFGLNGNKPLNPNTTYRLQFYALMDPEYDNTLNVSNTSGLLDSTMNTLSPIMDRDGYYPRNTHQTLQRSGYIQHLIQHLV